jgi:peptidoglycan/LPS O-acetylase OafA/YrhL
MVAAFAFPTLPTVGGIKLNGLCEAACVVLLFPVIVLAGSHSNPGRGMTRLCKVTGRISYPIYITHFPFPYVWMNYVARGNPSQGRILGFGIALIPFLTIVAWAAYNFWDEPIRSRLRRTFVTPR